MKYRSLRSLALACSLLTASACTGAPEPAALPPLGGTIRYHFTWDTQGVDFADDGQGWQIENDRGYTITVNRALFVSYSAELMPCEAPQVPVAAEPVGKPTAALRPWSWLAVTPAFAGHSLLEMNPARILPHRSESLLKPETALAGEATPAAELFCGVHYLVARAQKGAEIPEEDADIMGKSLLIDGSYRKGDDGTETTFEIRSTAANGRIWKIAEGLPDWQEPESEADLRHETVFDSARSEIDVTITRRLGVLFNEVDFAVMSERAISWVVLRNLMATAQLEIEVADEEALSVRKNRNDAAVKTTE